MREEASVIVNGTPRVVRPPISLRGLIDSLGLEGDAVAVERNRRIVRRADWNGTALGDGDMIEIVHFVGGG